MKLSEIAILLGGELSGNADTEIKRLGKIESASADEITFIANPVYEKFYNSTNAGAIIVSKRFKPPVSKGTGLRKIPLIKVDDPYLAFLELLEVFSPRTELEEIGVSEFAVISETAELSDEKIRISANCFIGEKCKIGKGTRILPNSVVLAGTEIGENVLIYPNVTIYYGCKIGNNVIIHSGTVIGSDGFGFTRRGGQVQRMRMALIKKFRKKVLL